MKKVILLSFCLYFSILNSSLSYAESFQYFKPDNIKKAVNTSNNKILFQTNIKSDDISNSYLPENSEPINNYVLGVGDILQIDMLSRDIDFEYTIQINPEGKIFIPKVGEFIASGLTTNKLKEIIHTKISKKIKVFELSVFLTKLKSINVFLTGYANKPGSYNIPYNLRLFELLKHFEGVTENGSIRNIEITSINNDKKIYDLNNFIYKGVLEDNPKIKAGDKIFIPYINKRITIVGEISKPGTYEIKNSDNLIDILKLSGAHSNGLDTQNIKVWKDGMNKIYQNQFEVNLKDLNNNLIDNGDILYIPSIRQPQDDSNIHIYGQIVKSGSLPFKKGSKFSDYFKMAGGANNVADLDNVKLTRTKNINGKIITENYLINANDIIYNGKAEKDIYIEPNDVIFIPERFFNFRNFTDITSLVLSTLGIVSLVLSFTRN